jgi:hypothetical protein
MCRFCDNACHGALSGTDGCLVCSACSSKYWDYEGPPKEDLDKEWDKAHQSEMVDDYMRLGAGGSPKSETIDIYVEDYDYIMSYAKERRMTFTQVLENYILPTAREVIKQHDKEKSGP